MSAGEKDLRLAGRDLRIETIGVAERNNDRETVGIVITERGNHAVILVSNALQNRANRLCSLVVARRCVVRCRSHIAIELPRNRPSVYARGARYARDATGREVTRLSLIIVSGLEPVRAPDIDIFAGGIAIGITETSDERGPGPVGAFDEGREWLRCGRRGCTGVNESFAFIYQPVFGSEPLRVIGLVVARFRVDRNGPDAATGRWSITTPLRCRYAEQGREYGRVTFRHSL